MRNNNLLQKLYPPQRHWNGKWIWSENCDPEINCYYYFRKEFILNNQNESYQLCIAAESKYRLFINGMFVCDGSPQSQPFYKYFDQFDASKYLKEGLNCIAVLVYHLSHNSDLRGGLLADLYGASDDPVVFTDESWKTKRAVAWNNQTQISKSNIAYPYQEIVDLNLLPGGWPETDFDDSLWSFAKEIPCGAKSNIPLPWSRLVARDIPFMAEVEQLPKSIVKVEECLSITNRWRPEDLSICLSTPGNPLRYSTVSNAENLLNSTGSTEIRNSTNHLDGVFDGVYDPCILIDFGKVITAYITIDVDGVQGGTIDIGYAERLIDGYFNNAIECFFADRVILKEGSQTFRTFAWRGFRYVRLRVGSCFNEIKIRSIKANITTYPYHDNDSFNCGDIRVNSIFNLCRHTIRLCSNEFLMDTPWREQGQWLGDIAAVTGGGIYACFGDTALMAKFLKQSAMCQQPTGFLVNKTNDYSNNWQGCIVDFSLWWIHALWTHYLYTGDQTLLYEFYPQVSRIIQGFFPYIDEHGLLNDMPYWTFIDWAAVDRRGECTALNAQFYGTLEIVEKMCELKKDDFLLTLVREARQGIRENFNNRLFDTDKGCFADCSVGGKLSDKISEHANLSAILWGLCDNDNAEKIIDAFYSNKSIKYTEAQPFYTSVVLKALHRIGRRELALSLLLDRWGKRMADKGATSCYEEWYINGSWRSGNFQGFLRSLSHAWSAFPAEFLTAYLIGLEIVEPGGRKIKLNPTETGFDYVVRYPLPAGTIKISYDKGKFDYEIPNNIQLV